MYVRLNDEYILRGWQGVPHALVYPKQDAVQVLLPPEAMAAELLDGEIDLDCVLLTAEQREFIGKLVEHGVAVGLESPEPLRDYQRYRQSKGAYIQGVCWAITGGCNLHCKHCYMGAPHHRYKDLDTQTCLDIIQQMAEAGVYGVSFSGGEPLTRKDFWELTDACLERGIWLQKIYTNGILIDDTFLDNLEQRNLRPKFTLSFDGVGCHDWMRGTPGAEEKTIAAIRKVISRGFRLQIYTTLYSGSIGQLMPTYELLKDLGIDELRVAMTMNTGEWRSRNIPDVPLDDLFANYLELVQRYMADGLPFDINVEGVFGGTKGGKPYIRMARPQCDAEGLNGYSCEKLRLRPYLLPDGVLAPCAALVDSCIEKDMPNVLDTPLAEIYRRPDGAFRKLVTIRAKDVVEHNKDCKVCAYRFECGGGCRAFGIYTTGDPLGKGELFCRFYKNYRAKLGKLLGV
jgi:radical SAM protein with 4Fe4S-binding SPASM domain